MATPALDQRGIRQFYMLHRDPGSRPLLVRTICSLLGFSQAVVFCKDEEQCQSLPKKLARQNLRAARISNDMPQEQREELLQRFIRRRLHILVTMGVWPEGLPVEKVHLVFNYELPMDCATYVKQIGQCDGTAAREALVITFAYNTELERLRMLEQKCATEISELPTDLSNLYHHSFPYFKFKDVFLDLDNTLVFAQIEKHGDGKPQITHRYARGALELLRLLSSTPGVRINFFSCAPKSRNESLAKKMMEESGNANVAYDVFSDEHMVEEGDADVKRLKGLKHDLDMERAILVDDYKGSAAQGEERNLILAGKQDKNEPDPYDSNLALVAGLIVLSIEAADRTGGSVVEALNSLRQTNVQEVYDYGLECLKM